MQARNYTWAFGALYKLGKDGRIRRCISPKDRAELLKEAHEEISGGHMARETLLEDYSRHDIGGDLCSKMLRNGSKHVTYAKEWDNLHTRTWDH